MNEILAAATLIWDPSTVKAIIEGKPEEVLKEGHVVPSLIVKRTRRLNREEFEKFLSIMRELEAKWDGKRWVIQAKYRDPSRVLGIIEELRDLGIRFVYQGEEVEIDEDLVNAALMKGMEMVEKASSAVKGEVCVYLDFLKPEEREVLREFCKYKGGSLFCCKPVPNEKASEIIERRATGGKALALALAMKNKKVSFVGNYVVVNLGDKLEKFLEIVRSYENCEIRDARMERARREEGFSYCECKWVQGEELELHCEPKRTFFEVGDGVIKIYRGLYYRLLKSVKMEGEDYDERIREEWANEVEFLRDYQREAVASALKLLRIQGAATIQAATGAGKTEMAVAIAKLFLEKGLAKKVFFLSLSKTLNLQAANRFKKYGIFAGLVDAENFQVHAPVVACTVQTLYRALEKLGKVKKVKDEKVEDVVMDYVELNKDKAQKLVETYLNAELVIVDEVQHVPARTVKEVIMANPNSYRLGLSATPWRDDGRDLLIYAVIGDVAERKITSSELIEKGYLVPVRIIMLRRKVKVPEEEEEKILAKNGVQRYVALKNVIFYKDEERNELIAKIVKVVPKPVLVLVKEIKHAKLLEEKIREKGVKVRSLTGKESISMRESTIRLLISGSIDAIVATTLADEGLDLPPLRTLVLAGGGRSQTRTLQRVGRITRPYKDKKEGLVVDIWDVDIDYGGIFYRQGLARKELYESERAWRVEIKNEREFFKEFHNLEEVLKKMKVTNA